METGGRVDMETRLGITIKYAHRPRRPVPAVTDPMVDQTDAPRFRFNKVRQYWFKVALLSLFTVALVPILLMKHELAATLYLIFLAVVHVGGLWVFARGVSREDVAPSLWGFWGRMIGIAFAIVLLYLVSKGLQDATAGLIFWGSLFAIWAIHTVALALLHIRGRNETVCPFG